MLKKNEKKHSEWERKKERKKEKKERKKDKMEKISVHCEDKNKKINYKNRALKKL